jgi:hypothetical protein
MARSTQSLPHFLKPGRHLQRPFLQLECRGQHFLPQRRALGQRRSPPSASRGAASDAATANPAKRFRAWRRETLPSAISRARVSSADCRVSLNASPCRASHTGNPKARRLVAVAAAQDLDGLTGAGTTAASAAAGVAALASPSSSRADGVPGRRRRALRLCGPRKPLFVCKATSRFSSKARPFTAAEGAWQSAQASPPPGPFDQLGGLILNFFTAGVGSALPAASVALTWNRCLPTFSFL